MEKINYLHNGQWALNKSRPSSDFSDNETHEVEVHPDIDHLYRLKDTINRSGRPYMTVKDIERTGLFNKVLSRVPRDASGKVTSQMIDDHISKLPKQKLIIRNTPYTWGAQMHHPAANEHVVSVHIHPNNIHSLPPNQVDAIRFLLKNQHDFGNLNDDPPIGWARVDHSKDNHWHVDELQSDFQHKDKIERKLDDVRGFLFGQISNAIDRDESHPLNIARTNGELSFNDYFDMKQNLIKPEYEKQLNLFNDNIPKDKDGAPSSKAIHKFLSHGFEDPQDLIQAAVNALARKKGVASMSMDTPEDQAVSSGLFGDPYADNLPEEVRHEEFPRHHPEQWEKQLDQLKDGTHPSLDNPNFKSALDKLGISGLTMLANVGVGTGSSPHIREHARLLAEDDDPEGLRILSTVSKMSQPEIHAVDEMMDNHLRTLEDLIYGLAGLSRPSKSFDPQKMPVHFRDTYIKRPKEAGYQLLPKRDVLGMGDEGQQVQFAPVYKTIKQLRNKLNKIKRI